MKKLSSGMVVCLFLLAALAAGQSGHASNLPLSIRPSEQPVGSAEEEVTLDILRLRLIDRKRDKDVFELSWRIDKANIKVKKLLIIMELAEVSASNPQKRSVKKELTLNGASKTQLIAELASFRNITVNGKKVCPSLKFNVSITGQGSIEVSAGSNGQVETKTVRLVGIKSGVINHEEQYFR